MFKTLSKTKNKTYFKTSQLKLKFRNKVPFRSRFFIAIVTFIISGRVTPTAFGMCPSPATNTSILNFPIFSEIFADQAFLLLV